MCKNIRKKSQPDAGRDWPPIQLLIVVKSGYRIKDL
jgi:hypothetical protein